MNTQTLDGRYVDREKLVKLLQDLFGAGNFQIKVRSCFQGSFHSLTLQHFVYDFLQAIDDNVKVSAPRALTEVKPSPPSRAPPPYD